MVVDVVVDDGCCAFEFSSPYLSVHQSINPSTLNPFHEYSKHGCIHVVFTFLLCFLIPSSSLPSPLLAAASASQQTLQSKSSPPFIAGFVQLVIEPASLNSTNTLNELEQLRFTMPAASTIGVSILLKQSNYSSDDIHSISKTPTLKQLGDYVDLLHQLGFQVLLKPGVLPGDSILFSDILPANLTQWFENFQAMLLQYAQFCTDHHVEFLAVGLEYANLTTNSQLTAHSIPLWLSLFKSLRTIYQGRLTYSALPTEFSHIPAPFWKGLDLIGLDAYLPLATPQNPSFDPNQIIQLFDQYLAFIQHWQISNQLTSIPVFFSELGYPSSQTSLFTPWMLPAASVCQQLANQTLQAQIYQIIIQIFVLHQVPALEKYNDLIQGMLIFTWSLPGLDHEGEPQYPCGWNPRGKLAEQVFQQVWNQTSDDSSTAGSNFHRSVILGATFGAAGILLICVFLWFSWKIRRSLIYSAKSQVDSQPAENYTRL